MEITIDRARQPRELPTIDRLGFGRHFADHMFVLEYHADRGWHDARIVPYEPLLMDPSSLVLHYGQSIFEGLKAYRWGDDSVHLFRAENHVERFLRSARRMVMPEFDPDLVLRGIRTLIDVDRRWVPSRRGTALYIRPTLIATQNLLGVKPADRYLMFVIASPVGAYYSRGMEPTRIWVEERYARAVEGGTGEAKTGANYAQSLLAATEAQRNGYDQVLWLDAKEHRHVEEVGTMNIFFVIDDVLITPPLAGTILDGVTRRSVLDLARDWGIPYEERRITIDEVLDAHAEGRLQEAFGSGTAAVIAPIGLFHYRGRDFTITERPNSLRERLYEEISGIQYGEIDDKHGWTTKVPDLIHSISADGAAAREVGVIHPGAASGAGMI